MVEARNSNYRKLGETILKNTIALLVLATWLAACATNETTASAEGADDTTTSATEAPARKKVCNYERGTSTGTRMRKVFKYVDES